MPKRDTEEDTSASSGEAQDTTSQAAASSPDAEASGTEESRPSLVDTLVQAQEERQPEGEASASQGETTAPEEDGDLDEEDIFGLAGADRKAEDTQSGDAKDAKDSQDTEVEDGAGEPDEDPDLDDPEAQAAADEELGAEDPEAAEDHSDLPFHKHPRFRKIVKERRKFRRQAQRLKAQVAELEAPAEQSRQIQKFMSDFSVSPDEMTELFQYRALLTQNPQQARELLYQQITALDARLGNTLPEDLATEVNAGRIDAETASRLAKERAGQTLAVQNAQRDRERAEATAQQVHVGTISAAVDAWERGQEAGDPDYGQFKKQLVADRLRAMRAERGMPDDAETAVKWAQEALDGVNTLLGSVRGAGNGNGAPATPSNRTRPLQRNLNSDQGGRTSGGIPEGPPGSMMEAVARGIAMTKG